MNQAVTLAISTVCTFLGHHFGERYFTRANSRKIRIILKGYQIHHSFFGLAAVAIAVIFTSGWLMFVLFGYSLGNLWQHKWTHNRAGEKGLIFISRIR